MPKTSCTFGVPFFNCKCGKKKIHATHHFHFFCCILFHFNFVAICFIFYFDFWTFIFIRILCLFILLIFCFVCVCFVFLICTINLLFHILGLDFLFHSSTIINLTFFMFFIFPRGFFNFLFKSLTFCCIIVVVLLLWLFTMKPLKLVLLVHLIQVLL